MKRGRPIKSQIRQNIIEILYFLKEGYAYQVYKIYRDVFPKVTMRSIYYHLNKGKSLGEFEISKVEKEKGDVEKELKERLDFLEMRAKVLAKQENNTRERLTSLQESLQQELKLGS